MEAVVHNKLTDGLLVPVGLLDRRFNASESGKVKAAANAHRPGATARRPKSSKCPVIARLPPSDLRPSPPLLPPTMSLIYRRRGGGCGKPPHRKPVFGLLR